MSIDHNVHSVSGIQRHAYTPRAAARQHRKGHRDNLPYHPDHRVAGLRRLKLRYPLCRVSFLHQPRLSIL